jgi:hypothetical protein
MKLKALFLAAFAALSLNGQAANYYVNNVVAGGSTDVLIENNSGALLDGGIVAIGYFASGAPSSSIGDIQTTIANFTLQHSVLAGSPSADLGDSVAGYFQSSILAGGQITVGSPLLGLGVYLFAGNAATLAASTEFALVRVGTIADDVPFNQQYTADAAAALTAGALIIGNVDTAANPLGGVSQSLQLVPVPEPSVALLGLLGAVGFFRRRR